MKDDSSMHTYILSYNDNGKQYSTDMKSDSKWFKSRTNGLFPNHEHSVLRSKSSRKIVRSNTCIEFIIHWKRFTERIRQSMMYRNIVDVEEK